MSAEDLSAPLGIEHQRPSRFKPLIERIPFIMAATGSTVLLAGLAYVLLKNDPLGGEPRITLNIPREASKDASFSRDNSFPRDDAAASHRTRTTAQELELDSGVQVVRPGGGSAPGSVIIRAPVLTQTSDTVRLVPAPDARLVERGRHGPIPKVASDGATPLETYARPLISSTNPKAKIAIIVGGLGINNAGTQEAITRLPGAVTLAFAPYGIDLERTVGRARDDGHEVLLQLPMEPFDYPDNDPGPQTLLTTASPEQNRDKLHWLLSRFSGFVGVMNYMGGKLSADVEKMTPLVKEIGSRGLMYLDDGTSSRTQVERIASEHQTPALKADMTLDTNPKPQNIDANLARLESLALDKGTAVAVATALPVTIERLATWTRTLEARGIEIVPISAMALAGSRR